MSPNNFREDDEFIKLIRRSERQSVILETLSKKVDDGFCDAKNEIKEIKNEIKNNPHNCANYKPKDQRSFMDIIYQSPIIIKLFLVVLVGIVAYFLGIDLNV
jgi:hypothetical protein